MQNELISMILGSLAAAASVAWPRRAFIFGVLSLSQGMFLGTVGVGGVGFIGCLFVADHRSRVFSFIAATALGIGCFFRPSAWGRLLGIFEGFQMAASSDLAGVGWGQWTWHQAAAQREVLRWFPMEPFKNAAAYFGVAPSLPAHLFAELGLVGLWIWIGVIGIAIWMLYRCGTLRFRVPAAFAVVFLLASIGTTPVQRSLTFDEAAAAQCDVMLAQIVEGKGGLHIFQRHCPEIRRLEFEGSLLEGLGDLTTAESAYRIWHETFPRDVMPAYALGRLALLHHRKSVAKRWFEVAAQGNPKNDRRAAWLRGEAERFVSGDAAQERLWNSAELRR
ncbi:MAG TPA: hypothetical protein VI895_10390 [Bdellovibrionota bacterium]|nr:hypothetical protein [Bdellovibrionota bacterium]